MLLITTAGIARETQGSGEPVTVTYKIVGSDSLKAFLFYPKHKPEKDTYAAIAIFHGGGWSIGEASWAFGSAKKFAELGLMAIAVQYRLSNQNNISPLDAIDDARDFILWARENADKLNLDKNKLAAYGWSAGAHLIACTAVFPSYGSIAGISSCPDALILKSPALSIVNDSWFKKLLPEGASPEKHSPAENIKGKLPPSIILIGKEDSVTPLEGSALFHKNMKIFGNDSQLHIYEGVGHLFTPAGQADNGWPKPDKKISEKADKEIELFLKEKGFMK